MIDHGIWHEEAGDPNHPLVVLVHGSMDRAAGLLKVSRRLDEQYLVLRFDRRGYGRSQHHDGPYEMAGQVADLVELLAGRRAVLVGHSFGGQVALSTAAHHPDLVAGVAVYESPLSWQPWWPSNSAGSRAVAQRSEPEQAAEAFMRRMIGDARWEALPERTRETRLLEGRAMVGELADLRLHAPWEPHQLTMPIAAGIGSRCSEHQRQGMTWLAGHVAGATLVELDGCGHDAPARHPEQFTRELVLPLLQRVGAPWG